MDDDAIARVIRENPALATDALASLEESLADGLETTIGARGVVTGAREFLSAQHGYPVVWTEPRATVVDDVTSQSLDATVDRLLARIVRPKRRSGGPRRPNPTETIEKTVQSLIAKRVVTRKHYFEKSLSGIPRGVDFFVNSTANLALDVVNLSVQSADEILRRADAEAFKVQDVTSGNRDVHFLVCTPLTKDDRLGEVNELALRAIRTAGAGAIEEPILAAQELLSAAGRQ